MNNVCAISVLPGPKKLIRLTFAGSGQIIFLHFVSLHIYDNTLEPSLETESNSLWLNIYKPTPVYLKVC